MPNINAATPLFYSTFDHSPSAHLSNSRSLLEDRQDSISDSPVRSKENEQRQNGIATGFGLLFLVSSNGQRSGRNNAFGPAKESSLLRKE